MFAVFFSDDENMWNIIIFIVENLNFQDLTRSCTCTFLVKSGPWWTEWQKAHIFIYSREHHLDQAIIWGELSVSVWFAAILKHKICSFGTTNMWFAENTVCCTEALIQKQLWQSQKHPDNTFGCFIPWYSGMQQVHTEYWMLTRGDGSNFQKLHSTTLLSQLPKLWRYCEEEE